MGQDHPPIDKFHSRTAICDSSRIRAGGAPPLTVAEEMTGRCGGASAAVQLACALLEPLAAPALILTGDTTGTVVAMAVLPWQP